MVFSMSTETLNDILFPLLSQSDIECLIPYGSIITLEPGEIFFHEGEQFGYFAIVLDGEIKISKQAAGGEIVLTVHETGGFVGEIGLMTRNPAIATARATKRSQLLRLEVMVLRELLNACPTLSEVILPALIRRRPEADLLTQQREKMAALGKLSAGLAHELNNPAAAAKRSAGYLQQTLTRLNESFFNLNSHGLTADHWATIKGFLADVNAAKLQTRQLDSLTQSDLESELGDWLEEQNIPDGWNLASTLVQAGLGREQLSGFLDELPRSSQADVLVWLEASIQAGELSREIEHSASRISTLVKAVKSYSYMDQSPVQEIDLHESLNTTLTILNHKLKTGISVLKEYRCTVERIVGYGSELNQVWTNLIDNAIDALGGQGSIWLRTSCQADLVVVEIVDNGPGIPAEIRSRIFEPFFTTKQVGQGSGLGLDIAYRIVRRHGGDILVDSQPGNTSFTIRLPIGFSS